MIDHGWTGTELLAKKMVKHGDVGALNRWYRNYAANVALSACQALEASFLPEGLDQEKVGKLNGTQLKVLLRCWHGAGMSISLLQSV